MMRIEFTVDDVARVHFRPEPAQLLELKLALLTLHRDPAPRLSRWRRAALAHFPAAARPLCALAAGFSGTLSTTGLGAGFDEGVPLCRG